MSELVVERANVAKAVAGEMEAPKGETADLSSLGGAPCWIVLKSPVAFKPLLGRERAVRFVKVPPDAAPAFKGAVEGWRRLGAEGRPASCVCIYLNIRYYIRK